ncbi:diacylglycerol/lipid kinase family protein [Rhodobacter lacus]|uniref:Diacylglycerol/lipid kinase family protein n=1 Tax=Rhodobacter lacus TaxID=1641972 RepID=A0ABW5A5T5_9RHOB
MTLHRPDPPLAAPVPAPDARLCVIVNSGSGAGAEARLERLRAAFATYFPQGGWSIAAGGPEQILPHTRRALARGIGTVVACGGDGTIAAVAEEVRGAGARFGVIPTGTFNFFARGLGIPEEIEAAVAVLAGGLARPVQVGTVNGRLFLNNASIGLYPRILREREEIYRRWGRSRIAAHWSVLRTMVTMPGGMDMEITSATGTHHVHSPLAFVMNNPYQLDFLGIEGAERLRGGELALLLAPAKSVGAMLSGAVKLGLGMAERKVDYHISFAPGFTITPARRHLLTARDGERGTMRAPLVFRAEPDALVVIGPEAADRSGAAPTPASAAMGAITAGVPA